MDQSIPFERASSKDSPNIKRSEIGIKLEEYERKQNEVRILRRY